MLLNCGVGEDSWESLGLQRDPTRKSVLNIHWKDWCWSWNSNTLAIWCIELTYWKRSWCWKRLKAGGEGGNRGWDGWMASPTQWAWVWASSRSWWWRAAVHGVAKSHTWLSDWTDWTGLINTENMLLKMFLRRIIDERGQECLTNSIITCQLSLRSICEAFSWVK